MESRLCRQRSSPCQATGTFNPDNSSTYQQVSDDFDISYVDGEYARGDYGKDVFTLSGGAKVTGLQFGVGLDTTSTDGIMGIGFDLNEVQVQRLGKEPYRNLVDLMVDQKLIRSRAYSLWLNDLGESILEPRPCQRLLMNLKMLPLVKYCLGEWTQPSSRGRLLRCPWTNVRERPRPVNLLLL